jgi:hypothetical protein
VNDVEQYELLGGIKEKVDRTAIDVAEIKTILQGMPCKTHTLRLTFLEIIIYGACGIVLTAWLASLVFFDIPIPQNKPAVSNAVFLQWAE